MVHDPGTVLAANVGDHAPAGRVTVPARGHGIGRAVNVGLLIGPGSDELEWGGLQDSLIVAMKREQHAVEFYSRMMSVLLDEEAKLLCERLVHEELKHKQRLEILYDDLFYRED